MRFHTRWLVPACLGVGLASAAWAGERLDPPAAVGALAPSLTAKGEDVLLTWLEPMGPRERGRRGRPYRLRLARLADGQWSEPTTIVERGDLFVNWADVPSIAVAGDGALVAHWLQKSGPDTYAYDVVLARSTDDGVTWTTLGPVHDDGTKTEHGFVSFVPEANGVRAFWLDGREMTGDDHGHGHGEMTLRTKVVTDTLAAGARLDGRVCECCGTAAAKTSAGSIIAYRDRSEQEVRDVFVVRHDGERWSDPRPVHRDGWEIVGCPVNGPALAARGDRVVVGWYTGATEAGSVRVAFSGDGGATFADPIAVDETRPAGRVDILLDDRGHAIVAWLDDDETAPDGGAIRVRTVGIDGAMGPVVTVAEASTSRRTGFPRLAAVEGGLLVVWTADGEETRLRAALVSDLPTPPRP